MNKLAVPITDAALVEALILTNPQAGWYPVNTLDGLYQHRLYLQGLTARLWDLRSNWRSPYLGWAIHAHNQEEAVIWRLTDLQFLRDLVNAP